MTFQIFAKLLFPQLLLAILVNECRGAPAASEGSSFEKKLAEYQNEFGSLNKQVAEMKAYLLNQSGIATKLQNYEKIIKLFLEGKEYSLELGPMEEASEHQQPLVKAGLSTVLAAVEYKENQRVWMDGLINPNKHFQTVKNALKNVAEAVAVLQSTNQEEAEKKSALLRKIGEAQKEMDKLGQREDIKEVLEMEQTAGALDKLMPKLTAKLFRVGAIVERIAEKVSGDFEETCKQFYLQLYKLLEQDQFGLAFDNFLGHDEAKKAAVRAVTQKLLENHQEGLGQIVAEIQSKGAPKFGSFSEEAVLKLFQFPSK